MDIIRWLHIIIGSLALVTGALAIISVKGSRLHRQAGKWYVISMFLVAVSAIYMCVVKQNDFLFAIAIFSFYLTWVGKRGVERKISGNQKRTIPDHGVTFMAAVGCGYMLFIGATEINIIMLVFGSILLYNLFLDIRTQLKPEPAGDNALMRGHIGRMTGAYIATVTAFLVNNVTTSYPVVLWLTPTVLGLTFIIYSVRKWNRNNSEIEIEPE